MSGIFGFSVKNENTGRECLEALKFWNQDYGKQGTSSFLDKGTGCGCFLEHLSDEIDLSVPVIQTNELIAVIDAVLYNRNEILEKINVQKRETSMSDEELIIRLIQKQGYSSLAAVNGDFAGAIYDKERKTWTLFRDHMGVRPLFYYMDEKIFAFSTDLRGLAAIPFADIEINEKKLYLRMMGYNDLSLCETEFKNIYCVHPASWTVIGGNASGFFVDENIFWRLGQCKVRLKSDLEYQAELRRLIVDAIKCRLDAVTEDVGGELSGGLDSSVIAILISRLGRKGMYHSWSFSPEDLPIREGDDERKIISDICKQENITCHFSRKKSPERAEQLFQRVDPPYVNTRHIGEGAHYLRSQNVKIVFTGHGGDEGVSHRSNFFELWYHHEYLNFFRSIYRSTRLKKWRILRTIKASVRQIFVINPYFRRPFRKVHTNASAILNVEFKARMDKSLIPEPLYFAYDPVKYIMQGGTRVRLDNVALQGAENDVRYMVPFLDYRVIDYAISIPRVQYQNGIMNRYVFRKAFEEMIPQSLRDMHYKDAPSQRDFCPDFDIRKHWLECKEQLMKHLDWEFWQKYLDIKEIEKLTLDEDYTQDDYCRAIAKLNDLMQCWAVQNVKSNSSKLSKEYEKVISI